MTNIESIRKSCQQAERHRGWLGGYASETKCVSYAYATSDMAGWFGYASKGCYVLRTGFTAKAFATLEELESAYETSPLPVGIYCAMRDYREQEARRYAEKHPGI